ncbi:MAG: hypothetical protein CMH52_08560 [Myxococcales bacterium]|nr:hypothetical protein [Myxococcales bacterium]
MRLKRFLPVLGFLCIVSACGPSKPVIKPGPAIPGINLSGRWFSKDFGEMTIVHAGDAIKGEYADPRGPEHNGGFRGTLIGDLIKLQWIKPGKREAAVMLKRGRAYLRVSARGQKLIGRWGYDDSEDDGGPWRAEKSTSD